MKSNFMYNGKFYYYDQIEEVIKNNVKDTKWFDKFLNSAYGKIEIWNDTYKASEILKKCDPESYRQAFEEEYNNMIDLAYDMLTNADDGERIYITDDITFVAVNSSKNLKRTGKKKSVLKSIKKKVVKPKTKKKPVKKKPTRRKA